MTLPTWAETGYNKYRNEVELTDFVTGFRDGFRLLIARDPPDFARSVAVALLALSPDAVTTAVFAGLIGLCPIAAQWVYKFVSQRNKTTAQTEATTIERWKDYAATVVADRKVTEGERDRERARSDSCEKEATRKGAELARALIWIRSLEGILRREGIPFDPYPHDHDQSDSSGDKP